MRVLPMLRVGARTGAALAALLLVASNAPATTIQSTITAVGVDHYRAVYTVENDGTLGTALAGFSILFDPALYLESSLAIVTASPLADAWDETVLGSAVLVPAAYDVLALAGGIPVGSAAAGFAVEFTWLGPGAPGTQPFEVFDPTTFQVLETGTTTLVPDPGTMTLLAAGVGGLAGVRRRPRLAHRRASPVR